MIKCTDALFAQTSPTTFFRRNKLTKISQEEKPQITDPQIMQKLQLILISMRQQAAKASSYFEYQKNQLQNQLHEHSKIIQLLQEQNKLLRSYLESYVQKYGQLEPQITKIQLAKSQLYIQNMPVEQQNCDYLKVVNQPNTKRSSGMSTKYISNLSKVDKNSHRSTKSETQQNFMIPKMDHNFQVEQDSQYNSTSSNFFKKSCPFSENSLQNYKQHEIRILPLITKHKKSNQISQISQIQSLKNSIIDKFTQSCGDSQSIDHLGLQSRGSGFFQTNKQSQSCLVQQQTLLINESQQIMICQQSQVCIHPAFQDDQMPQQEDQYEVFQSQKTDSDIRKMNQILEAKFGNKVQTPHNQEQQSNQTSNQIHENCQLTPSNNHQNKTESAIKQLRELNDSYFKNLNIYQKRSHIDDFIVQNKKENLNHQTLPKPDIKSLQKKLKALFQPLPSNIISKKVHLPKKIDETKNIYPRQSHNLQKLSQLFNSFQNKKLLQQQKQNPVDKLNRRKNINKKIL